MSLAIDHVAVRTHALDAHRRFFEQLLDLEAGDRPDFGFPGYWLYADGRALVHLVPAQAGPGTDGRNETVDHVAFVVDDIERVRERAAHHGIVYTESRFAELGERRLFARSPTGIRIELIARTPPDAR